MGLVTYNPTSPGRRFLITTDRSELWKGKPVKTLTEGLSGRIISYKTHSSLSPYTPVEMSID